MSVMQKTVRILHLSDLHAGQGEVRRLFPNYRSELFEDIAGLVNEQQPIDLIVFTGDLTFKGAPDEFAQVTDELQRLEKHLGAKLRPNAPLLAVPGNHDLKRPSPKEGSVLAMLGSWSAVEESFWEDARGEYRRLVDRSFKAWSEWWGGRVAQLATAGIDVRVGLLPGDFSTTLQINGVVLGIVGLNSAFLQLVGGDLKGRLRMDYRQLARAIPHDVGDWFRGHDARLLLTHHPPDWLTENSRKEFETELAKPGNFTAHLFGHMHAPHTQTVRRLGHEAIREYQSASVFGMEHYADPKGDVVVQRAHGYQLLDISFDHATGHGALKLWPREARAEGGARSFVQSPYFKYASPTALYVVSEFEGVAKVAPGVAPLERATASAATAHFSNGRGPYDASLYVPRPRIEQQVIEQLSGPGRPVVLVAPKGYGRTWMMGRVASQWNELHGGRHTVRFNLRSLGHEALSDMGRLVYQLAEIVVSTLGLDEALLDALDPTRSHRMAPMRRLRNFFIHKVLADRARPLLLAMDDVEVIANTNYRADFYSNLRAWMDEDADSEIHRMRLMLATSAQPASLIEGEGTRSVFNITEPIELPPFSPEEVRSLAARYGLARLDESVVAAIHRATGGVPRRVAEALYQMVRPSS